MKYLLATLLTACCCFLKANTLHVGIGYTFSNLEGAADNAIAGDTILIHEGTYNGGQTISDLKGTASDYIYILAAPDESVSVQESSVGWHLINVAYLYIEGITFEQQTVNGVNIDDGSDYSTPSHHIIINNCVFKDINATGNNDLLKLSGLDDFEIRNCVFKNGSPGGSGIDMVGCHRGIIADNQFENMGSNSIQAKGGTQYIKIAGNFFKNGGQRSLNLGGSTGLAYFRPNDAAFEAADLQVYSNIFIGSVAPIAYVGSVRIEVINNTIYLPDKWVIRILQETVDSDRFVECGDNIFRNNIIYLDNNISTETNIGPDTRPETFTFSNNLWYNADDEQWSGPDIPVSDPDNIINQDPLFNNHQNEDFSLQSSSPAIGKGYTLTDPEKDYAGNTFNTPRSIGAHEGDPLSVFVKEVNSFPGVIYPNPSGGFFTIELKQSFPEIQISIYDTKGQVVFNKTTGYEKLWRINLSVKSGVYFMKVKTDQHTFTKKLVLYK